MGQGQSSVRKVNFEDVQYAIKQRQNYLLINTLDSSEQNCLITKTIAVNTEEQKVIENNLGKNALHLFEKEGNKNIKNMKLNTEKLYENFKKIL